MESQSGMIAMSATKLKIFAFLRLPIRIETKSTLGVQKVVGQGLLRALLNCNLVGSLESRVCILLLAAQTLSL